MKMPSQKNPGSSPTKMGRGSPLERLVTDTQISLEVSKSHLDRLKSKGLEPASKAERHVDQALQILDQEIKPETDPGVLDQIHSWFRSSSTDDEEEEKPKKKARETPSRTDILRQMRSLRSWGGAGHVRMFDVPLLRNPTRYSIVSDDGDWWATVRSEKGKGRGTRLFLEPGGGTIMSSQHATPYVSEQDALLAAVEHAEQSISKWGLEEPGEDSMWTRWFGKTAGTSRGALIRLASTLPQGSEDRRAILKMAQVFQSAHGIGDPVWVSSQGQSLAGSIRAVSFATGKVRYSVRVDGSTLRGLDSVLVFPRPEGERVEYDFDNEM